MKVAVVSSLIALLGSAHLITGSIDRKSTTLDFSQVSVTLNNGEYQGLVDLNGAFAIAVPDYAAAYKLQVHNLNYYFEPVVVEVSDEAHSAGKYIKAFLYSIQTGRDYRLMYPLQLEPTSRFSYFEERVPFDPTVYLKNPFVWMIGVSLVMSQMMKGMDKKELEEASKNQKELMGDMPSQCQQ